jgi:hypothetical protein
LWIKIPVTTLPSYVIESMKLKQSLLARAKLR